MVKTVANIHNHNERVNQTADPLVRGLKSVRPTGMSAAITSGTVIENDCDRGDL